MWAFRYRGMKKTVPFVFLLRGINHRFWTQLGNPVKPRVIQSFLIFDSMDRNLNCDNSLESC